MQVGLLNWNPPWQKHTFAKGECTQLCMNFPCLASVVPFLLRMIFHNLEVDYEAL